MTSRLPDDTTLILIDVQKGFDEPHWGVRNNPGAEKNIQRLLERWREVKRPVIHVRHDSVEPNSPLRPDRPGNAFKPEATPRSGEPTVSKSVNSAFIGTDLEARLRKQGVKTLVLCGFTTNHCVSTTTRMAGNLGFQTYLLSDSTVAYGMRAAGPSGRLISPEEMHEIGLAELNGEFATVLSTEQLLALL